MTANYAEPEMCDKCIELDGKIEHYERTASQDCSEAAANAG